MGEGGERFVGEQNLNERDLCKCHFLVWHHFTGVPCLNLGLKQLSLVHLERFGRLGRLEGLHLGWLGGILGLRLIYF